MGNWDVDGADVGEQLHHGVGCQQISRLNNVAMVAGLSLRTSIPIQSPPRLGRGKTMNQGYTDSVLEKRA